MNYLGLALDRAGDQRPHPNPRVGCVIVDADGSVAGEGAHVRPGTDHAEIVALKSATIDVTGATAYVTLEPCSHHGRTPPCADALIAAGIAKVVVGVLDPDERVSGTGIERLRNAGVEVEISDMGDIVEAADPAYFHHRRTGLPLITLKTAMTLDGNIAAADGTSQWITNEPARTDGHRLRASADAIMVGAGTVRTDDPMLNVRLVEGPDPRPVIVAGSTPLPTGAKIWQREPLVLAAAGYRGPGEYIEVATYDGWPAAKAIAKALGDYGLLDVLVEGGPTLAKSLLAAGLVDRAVFYYGAKIGGGVGQAAFAGTFSTLSDARDVEITGATPIGQDVRIDIVLKGS